MKHRFQRKREFSLLLISSRKVLRNLKAEYSPPSDSATFAVSSSLQILRVSVVKMLNLMV